MGAILSIIGFVLQLVSLFFSLKLLIGIFRTSGPLWGIGSLLLPPVWLFWLVRNWPIGKDNFLKSLAFALGGGVTSAAAAVIMSQ